MSLFWAPVCELKFKDLLLKTRKRDGYWGPMSNLCHHLLKVRLSHVPLFFFSTVFHTPQKREETLPLSTLFLAKLGPDAHGSFLLLCHRRGGLCSAPIRVNVDSSVLVQPALERHGYFSYGKRKHT